MFPGLTSRLSDSGLVAIGDDNTIDAKTDIIVVQSAENNIIDTIKPNFGGGFSGIVFIVNLTGDLLTLTSDGNIIGSLYAINQGKMMPLVYSRTTETWYPIFATLND